MTSHEMRNPLSAIVQCADWIGNSLSEFDTHDTANVMLPAEVIDSQLDAAQTIVMCAQHQKRIIDDVLTLSKLDSNLLMIAPVDVQPVVVIENSLKMFRNELQRNDLELRFIIDPSYHNNNIDWVKLDPSRVLQVLINLLTNAIKFTQTEPERRITINVGSSQIQPTECNGVNYLPRNSNRVDLTDSPDWGTGGEMFLEIQVSDTGRGLDEHERKLLFQRFSQTSPRTHVQYGGSGLGLFISRELSEMQGGAIGVKSETGVGSTFAFFVKARRSIPPGSLPPSPKVSLNLTSGKVLDPDELCKLPTEVEHPLPPKRKVLKISDSSRHVLVVEDNIVNQKVLTKQLRSAGCVVSVANHGAEALAFLKSSKYWAGNLMGKELSVVLMDLEVRICSSLPADAVYD